LQQGLVCNSRCIKKNNKIESDEQLQAALKQENMTLTDLRRQIRGVKASYRVVKNTLAKRALKGTSFASLDSSFEGTTAIAYTSTDPVALAKTLTTFVKATPRLTIKAAVVQGRAIQPAEVTDLANMPGKPELLAKLMGTMQAPVAKLVRTMNEVPGKFVRTLAAVRDAREKQAA